MKKLVFTLAMCIMAWSYLQAQVSRTIANTAGSLKENLGEDTLTVTDLTVTGTINARDFKIMRDNMPALERIDLSGASISAYSGTEGTSPTIGTVNYSQNQIPTRAFYDGNPTPSVKIKSLKLPLTTTLLASNALNFCQGLDSLFIPSGITNVGNALYYCSANYRVDNSNTFYGSSDGVLYRKTGTQLTNLIQYPVFKSGSYSIPLGVTTISSTAFAGNTLISKLKIPSSISSMSGSNIFAGCNGLSEIKIDKATPPSVTLSTFPAEFYQSCKLIIPKGSTDAYKAVLYWQNFISIVEFIPELTLNSKPTISITANSATFVGQIENFADSAVIAHGFCWNTTGNPTLSDSKIDKGIASTIGYYSYDITNLLPLQKYYVRAYATNDKRTVYGDVLEFTTLPSITLTTNAATSILQKSATLNGSISYTQAIAVSNYGFCWSTSQNPTILNSKEDMGTNPTAGDFSKNITGLNGATTYYYRTYATSNGNTIYGSQQSFTTALPDDYDITVQINGNGTVNTGGTTVSNGSLVNVLRGATKTFTIIPNAGYQITAVTYNGADVYAQLVNNQYTTPAANAYGTLVVSFGNNLKTIHVTNAGTLSTLLSAIDKSIITNLTVTGSIDARDFKCMRDEMTVLANLNLKDARIITYNGVGGTVYNDFAVSYPSNEIPQNSFVNSSWAGKQSLKLVNLPKTLISIGSSAFENCSNIKIIILNTETPPSWGGMSFGQVNPTAVYVPIGKVVTYKAASGWSSFNIVEPGISSSTPTINGLIYAPDSGPTEIKPFKVSGGLLTSDITITAPANFEISTKTGATFTPTNVITISPIDGMVADTTFYVRLKAGLSLNAYTGNITLESTGFTTQNIALNGAVRTTPETIHVETAGTLSSLLTTTEKAAITKLTVTGNIDARDVKCMRDEMIVLANLNLKDANIVAYNGNGGPIYWYMSGITSYLANEIPQESFYKNDPSSMKGKASLKSITLPTQTTSIGKMAFRNCSNLKSIIILNQTPPTMTTYGSSFDGVYPNAVYVSSGKVSAYKASEGWKNFNIAEYKLKTTTQTATNIKLNTAKVNGSLDVITDSPVTAHGFCWNTTGMPTIADSKVDNGATTAEGAYSNVIDNLTEATTYYVRAYATDGTSGTVYGDEVSFTTAEIPATSNLSGNYYNSQYWPKSKSPYTITGNVNLAVGTTLTIEPGVVVNFAGAYEIMTMGNIVANGNATDSITFNANGNVCTFLDFKNAKLGDSELSYLKMIGHKIMPPLYAKALKTQGICTDSLILNNVTIKIAEINSDKSVIIRNSLAYNLNGGSTNISFDKCQLKSTEFGSYMYSSANIKYRITNSVAESILVFDGSYNSTANILNSVIKSSNLGKTQLTISKSKLTNCSHSSQSYMPYVKIDSTIIINSSMNFGGGNCNITNSIIKTDSTQTININGTITKSQFIGNNNKLGGVGLDAVSGTITNSSIVNHRIGLQTNALTINNSNLINISQYAIKNTGATNIDAKNNFWGVGNTTTAAVKAKIWDYYRDMNLGTVSYTNYLATPNIDAPITPPQNFRKVAGTSGVNYSWNANPESDVKGYKLHYGAFDGFSFANSIDLGNVTSYNLPTASINDTVLVTAYDLQADGKEDMLEGHESWYSDDAPLPSKAGSISGLTTVCQGSKSVSYSVPTIANATSYRWTLPAGATSSSTNNSISVDFSQIAVSGKISVRGVNEYGEGDSTFVAVTVNSLPDKAGEINGTTIVCQGEKSQVYRVTPIPGATSYSWTLPEGVTGISNADTIKVDFSRTAVSDTIRVCGVNDCGQGVQSKLYIALNPLPDNGINIPVDLTTGLVAYYPFNGNANDESGNGNNGLIYGNLESTSGFDGKPNSAYLFPGNAFNYINIPHSNSLALNNFSLSAWIFSDTNFGSGQIIQKNRDLSSGHYGLYTTSVIGKIDYSTNVQAYVNNQPSIGAWHLITGTLSGNRAKFYVDGILVKDSVAPNSFVYSGSEPLSIGMHYYTGVPSYWTYPFNGKIDEVRIYNKVLTDSEITALYKNKTELNSTQNIVGSTTVCQGEKGIVYKVPEIKNAKSYVWTLPQGASGSSASDSIIVDYSNTAISGNITVKALNDCGESEISTVAVNVKPLLGTIGSISGLTEVCAGTGWVEGKGWTKYSIPEVNNANSYKWTLPAGIYIYGDSTSNSINAIFSNDAVSGNITVKAINDCGETIEASLTVIIKPIIGEIGTIAGENTVCAGSKAVIFTIPAVDNANKYVWILPNGMSGTSATNSISVDFATDAQSGKIWVRAENDCNATDSVSLDITVKPLIGSIGEISGTKVLCAGEKAITYTVPAVDNALTYEWTLPTGASGTSTTNSITVDYSNTAVSGNITVKAKNDCYETSVSTLAITVNAKPATPVITRTDYTLKSSSTEGNQWYNSVGAINGALNQEYIVTANEEYYVIVTKNGCSSEPSNKIRVDNTSIKSLINNPSIKIYPNPVRNELRLEYDGETSFEIVNLVGQVLYNGKLVKTAIVATANLFPGIYLIRFTQGNTIFTEKFIKE